MLGLAGFFTFRSSYNCTRVNKTVFTVASLGSISLITYALFFK